MKFLFTIILNCLLLAHVSEAHLRHGCSKEALRKLVESNRETLTVLNGILTSIPELPNENLVQKFSKKLEEVTAQYKDNFERYLDSTKDYGGGLKIALSLIKNSNYIALETLRKAKKLSEELKHVLDMQPSHYHKSCECNCKKRNFGLLQD